ncbi:MAG: S41 family peptidase [bacterium]|nr:S41 family peptidase [bacterium]
MKKTWLFIFLAVVVSGAVSYGLGYSVGFDEGEMQFPRPTPVQIIVAEGADKPADFDLSPLWGVYQALRERYVDQSKLADTAKLLEGAIAGFVSSLEDPYTVYVEPQEQQKFIEDLQGSFGGIGAEIGIRDEGLVIIAPLALSPAERAGLKAGDRILKIDDTFTNDMSLEEAVSRIRGEIGTEVTLFVLPKGADEPKDVRIVRQTIVVPSLTYEVKDGVGVVRLLNFNSDAPRAFARTMGDIRKLPSKKLIIDVRNNPGGFLDAAQEIASWFLPAGEVVVYEVDAGENRLPFISHGYSGLENFKIVVLMNGGSASASEILAGALRDIRGIKLVGERSFGKGSVQELLYLADGAVLKVTTAKWVTPNGTSINDEGLAPDIEVLEPQAEAGTEPEDEQLKKALEILSQ